MNWRLALKSKEEKNKIIARFKNIWEGIEFDIKNNSFWYEDWGEKPNSFCEQIQIAKKHFKKYPKLIPIFVHRYIPETPSKEGNPIFSVWQTDIIYYGLNLEHYFSHEFHYADSKDYKLTQYPQRKIEFWSDIAENRKLVNKY